MAILIYNTADILYKMLNKFYFIQN